MKKKILVMAILLLAVLVSAVPALAHAPAEGTVYEGDSVPGGVALGDTRTQVQAAYGDPFSCTKAYEVDDELRAGGGQRDSLIEAARAEMDTPLTNKQAVTLSQEIEKAFGACIDRVHTNSEGKPVFNGWAIYKSETQVFRIPIFGGGSKVKAFEWKGQPVAFIGVARPNEAAEMVANSEFLPFVYFQASDEYILETAEKSIQGDEEASRRLTISRLRFLGVRCPTLRDSGVLAAGRERLSGV